MKFFDRLLTIVITATLTSIFWIVFGGTLLEMANERGAESEPEPPQNAAPVTPSAPPIMEEAQPQPQSRPTPAAAPPPAPVSGAQAESGAQTASPPAVAPTVEPTPNAESDVDLN